jgi:hypothetical protein
MIVSKSKSDGNLKEVREFVHAAIVAHPLWKIIYTACSSLFVELGAIQLGITTCNDLSYTNIICENDCLEVVDLIHNLEKASLHLYASVLLEISNVRSAIDFNILTDGEKCCSWKNAIKFADVYSYSSCIFKYIFPRFDTYFYCKFKSIW